MLAGLFVVAAEVGCRRPLPADRTAALERASSGGPSWSPGSANTWPTPFLVEPAEGDAVRCAWYFRLLGAKVGRRVFLDTTDLCEFDLIAVGDEAALNDDCTLQTHLFEDRVMKVSTVGSRARLRRVGAWTLVLYDTRQEAGSAVEDLSLLMKGERLPAGTRWAGAPADAV